MIWALLLRNPIQTALAAAALAFFVAAGVQSWRLDRAQEANKVQAAEYALSIAAAAESARLVGAQYRALESAYQSRKEQAEATHAKETAVLQARLSAVVVERNRLRDQIADYARGPTDPADDSIAAARDRAEALGVLLGQADERAERDAKELETLNAEKRLLLDSWPK